MRTLAILCSTPSTRLKLIILLAAGGAIATPAWGWATQDFQTAATSVAAGLLMVAWAMLATRLIRLTMPTANLAVGFNIGGTAAC